MAVLLAGALGIERELSAQPAGLRTHALVSLGAALFTLTGTEIVHADPTRIAAQVVSGIGFLGGGAILREGTTVRGLTTAATLWAAAALGLASGLGLYGPALLAAVIALVVTAGLKRVEAAAFPRRRGQLVLLTVDESPFSTVLTAVTGVLPNATVTGVTTEQNGSRRIEMKAQPAPPEELPVLAERLLAVPGVVAVDLHR
ncbi:MgtC/SapB family protein [Geodermatophilus sp. TF02-6]|nr:MgtC/SapB family protein [Geodermatophilus sp. TF02-6]